jgi:alkylhydroperoxidase/carboxymuconolactone decarboxylase family protein YurZ
MKHILLVLIVLAVAACTTDETQTQRPFACVASHPMHALVNVPGSADVVERIVEVCDVYAPVTTVEDVRRAAEAADAQRANDYISTICTVDNPCVDGSTTGTGQH